MKENSGKKWLLEILPEIGENAPLHPLENFVAVLPALPNFKGENYLPKSLHKDWDDYISNIPFADIVMPKDPKIAPCDVATGHKWVNKNLWLHLPEWNWKERVRLVQKHLSQQDVKERNQTLEPTKFLAGK
jgi:hypothetical protein